MSVAAWPVDDWHDDEPPDDVILIGERAPAAVETWPEPEDRGTATLSAQAAVGDIVDDLIRSGRILVHAAEEGSGKTTSETEIKMRVAVAGGAFAGTWPILRTGNVLGLSEMHGDDEYAFESLVLESLGVDRAALAGRLFRLPLMTAANGKPALTVDRWRTWITTWMREHEIILLVVDTATGATQVDPWGREIQAVYAGLRLMLAEYPELAIILVVHVRKPTGRGERRLSDVLGEWGRWCDVVMLQENDGASLERAKITVRKRVRRERRIVATKAGGLLVDPKDLTAGSTKIPADQVYAAVAMHPGCSYAELGAALDVSKVTAANYVKADGARFHLVKDGPKGTIRVYTAADTLDLTAKPPNTAKRADIGDDLAVSDDAPPSAKPTYIGLAVGFAVDANDVQGGPPPPDFEGLEEPEDVADDDAPTSLPGRSWIDDLPADGDPSVVVEASPPETIECSDYTAHQRHHERSGAGWICTVCSGQALP